MLRMICLLFFLVSNLYKHPAILKFVFFGIWCIFAFLIFIFYIKMSKVEMNNGLCYSRIGGGGGRGVVLIRK